MRIRPAKVQTRLEYEPRGTEELRAIVQGDRNSNRRGEEGHREDKGGAAGRQTREEEQNRV